jgi:hypothetical protein
MIPPKRPVWFFVGLLLFLYGVIILSVGFWEIRYPPVYRPILFHLHAPIWLGATLSILGGIFFLRYLRDCQ